MLTSKELAARYKVCENTIRKWRIQGKGPKWIRIGGTIRYRLSDVESYEQQLIQNEVSPS